MQVSDEELAATEVPPYLGAPLLGAGAVLVVCVDLNVVAAFDQYLDRIGVIPGASVYPFVWNILLAARNEGYGGVLTTMAVAEEPRVKELLGIPDDYAIAALLPIGKPVKQVSKLTRKPVAEIATRSVSTESRSRDHAYRASVWIRSATDSDPRSSIMSCPMPGKNSASVRYACAVARTSAGAGDRAVGFRTQDEHVGVVTRSGLDRRGNELVERTSFAAAFFNCS